MPIPNLKAPIYKIVTKNGDAAPEEVIYREELNKRLLPILSNIPTQYLNGRGQFVAGVGDLSGPAISVEKQMALFDGATGKLLEAATGTGFVKVVSGVYQAPSASVNLASEVTGTLPLANVAALVETYALVMTGAPIGTGVAGFFSVHHAGTIVGVRVLSVDAATTAGDVVLDLWKDTYANYPPTVADTITAAAKPTMTADATYEDTTLTGWTTAVAAGDVIGVNVDSVATFTALRLELQVRRT